MSSKINLKALEQAVERLKFIEWKTDPSRRTSQMFPLREHIRQLALWVLPYGYLDVWPGGSPLFDLNRLIHSDMHIEHPAIQECLMYLDSKTVLTPQISTCEWYMRWEATKHLLSLQHQDLVSPYEPLIRMYERGGAYSIAAGNHAYIDGYGSFHYHPPSWYANKASFVQLEDSYLNVLDIDKS